jgi:RimJ/RimL family protein N-acetyltransferase
MSSPSPRPFAETSRLRIRSLRDSDIPLVATLYNDPHTSRTNPTWVVPKPDSALQKELSERIPTALLYSVIEAKEPLEDGNDWVGVVMLSFDGSPKNRDVEMAICLDARFWGKGYGMSAEIRCTS